MILSKTIIDDLKSVSGLSFEQFKDLGQLANLIQQKTKRSIGVTTLRRLFGLIDDGHQTYGYTLNTIALYLDFPSWTDYVKTKSLDSIWGYEDEAIYVDQLECGSRVNIKYLNRELSLIVKNVNGKNTLVVETAKNSSLHPNDILYVYKIEKGSPIVAERIIRDGQQGNYKTQGEVSFIEIIPPD